MSDAFADLSRHAVDRIGRVVEQTEALLGGASEELCLDILVDVLAWAGVRRVAAGGRDPQAVTSAERCALAREILREVADAFAPDDHRNAREDLPRRRTGGAIDFHWQNGWATYTVGFSLYPGTWRCAEVFLNVAKSEGMAEANARDAGILASFALQHGASLAQLVAAVTHEPDGTASSIVGTALNLVAAEIGRLQVEGPRDGDAPHEPDAGASRPPDAPTHGGDGGASIAAAIPGAASEPAETMS